MEKIIGRNPVIEAIKAGRGFEKIVVQKNAEGSIGKLISEARKRNIEIRYEDKQALDRIAGSSAHQGVVAFVSDYQYFEIEDMLKEAADKNEPPLIVVVDGIEDPHNLGAIIRSAEGAGAHGVVIPKRRAVGVSDIVAKASAGAVEYMKIAQEANITRVLKQLKDAGLWVTGLDMRGESYYKADLQGSIALVVGGEGAGISRLVKDNCDFVVSIPMAGKVDSLNAGSATAVLLYEIKRQRLSIDIMSPPSVSL
ncbi:23S rRNA (guanosine(2251)-2'-O)-methyltransferase RlmB [Clostridia bacterium]|nr:23S rRNA (guanosine(2251)-2'-O)-methyltransferase RlmB [Clostridia bacterium]